MITRIVGTLLAIAINVGAQGDTAGPTETLTVPTFGRVMVYAPTRAPDQVVLFISGDGGWNLGVVSKALPAVGFTSDFFRMKLRSDQRLELASASTSGTAVSSVTQVPGGIFRQSFGSCPCAPSLLPW